jgi:peptidoglycan/xylan/chitin deacetylase (PgdA/CDA1 family)
MRTTHPIPILLLALATGAFHGCRPVDRCCDPGDFVDGDAPLQPDNGAGFVLSFDDAYVDAWWETADLLEAHGARATFFVSRIDRLDEEQVERLRQLEARGHEVGCHGYRHLKAGVVDREGGADAWAAEEILPALDAFADAGLAPTSFAFPHGEHTDDTGEAALRYFDRVRGSRFIGPVPEVRDVDAVFLPAAELPGRRFSCSFAIDERYGITSDRLTRALERASERDEVLALYGHEPLEDADGGYETSHALLRVLLEHAAEDGLRSYLYREFGDTP